VFSWKVIKHDSKKAQHIETRTRPFKLGGASDGGSGDRDRLSNEWIDQYNFSGKLLPISLGKHGLHSWRTCGDCCVGRNRLSWHPTPLK
jgi:hypothetical protein